jgi:ATP/maltotriose-dependent transcriptional regulator MalT
MRGAGRENRLPATRVRGRARISITRDDTHLVVEVEDDGRGEATVRPAGGLAEHSVLRLMAEGLSNQAIGRRLLLSESAISEDTTALFGKLGIADDDKSNRRVLAVLAFLHKP